MDFQNADLFWNVHRGTCKSPGCSGMSIDGFPKCRLVLESPSMDFKMPASSGKSINGLPKCRPVLESPSMDFQNAGLLWSVDRRTCESSVAAFAAYNRRMRLAAFSGFTQECLSSVEGHMPLAIPRGRQLLEQVAGADATDNDYLYGGFGSAIGIRAALRSIGMNLAACEHILDFGCGPARILRWLRGKDTAKAAFQACDINSAAIEWCRANIPSVEFSLTGGWPPLPYKDRTFDLVYGISVLTHLNESMQIAWLDELYRITRPGGIVLLTVHGEDKAATDLSPEEHENFRKAGFLFRAATVKATVDGLPDFYQVAFHSEGYVRKVWAKHFDVLGYVTHGCMYAQHLVILRAKAKDGVPSDGYRTHPVTTKTKLPLAAIETPLIGTFVDEAGQDRGLELRGWAFNPDGEIPEIQVSVDGRIIAICEPRNPHPVVANAFPLTPAAANCGFSVKLPVSSLQKGWHVAALTLKDDAMPLWATVFRCKRGRLARFAGRLLH
jgi:SAM-dependent methyltransferase